MKKRIFSFLLAICLILPLATVGFATYYYDKVSFSVNIMEETGIERANSKLAVNAYSGSNHYDSTHFFISNIHWYKALDAVEDGKTAADYEYDAANFVYLKEMTAEDLFEKECTYAVRFSVRTKNTGFEFAPASNEDVLINSNAINTNGYNGTYSFEDFVIGNTIQYNAIINVYTLLPSSSVKNREYDVWVAGSSITKYNKDDVFGNGTVRYVPAAEGDCAKLYLNNITKSSTNSTSQITSDGDLELIVEGDNSLKSTYNSAFTVETSGISVKGNLIIRGTGTLSVNARASTKTCDGITCTGDLYIGGSVHLNSTAIQGSSHTYGIHAAGSLTIAENAVVRVYAAKEPGSAYNVCAIRGNSVRIIDNADVVTENGQACKNSNYGIYAVGNFVFSGNRLTTNRCGSSGSAIYASSKSFGNVICYGANDSYSSGTEIATTSISSYGYLRFEKAYNTKINGQKIRFSNKNDVLGDGTVQYIPADNNKPARLNLDGASLSKILADEDIVIDVLSSSSVNASSSSSAEAITVNGKCYLKGDILYVRGGTSGYGIKVSDVFNLCLDELSVDGGTAVSAAYNPKSTDEVYVAYDYGSDSTWEWEKDEPI